MKNLPPKPLVKFLTNWFLWIGLGLLGLILYLGLWSFVYHFVILPTAIPGKHGLKVDVFDRIDLKGKPSRSYINTLDKLSINNPDSSMAAYGLWNVSQTGLYRLHLECDDFGSLSLDGQDQIRLTGINARNIGEAEINLEKGSHLLVLRLSNGPGQGWLTLNSVGPRHEQSLLSSDSLTILNFSNLNAILRTVQKGQKVGLVLLSLSLGMLTLLALFHSGRSLTEIIPQGRRPEEKRSATFLYLMVSLLSLVGIFILPSGVECIFDGLPWSNKAEVLVLIGITPFLLIVGWKFLNRRMVAAGLMLLFGIKVFLAILAPASGWSLRIYENPQTFEKGLWEKSYEGVWRPGISGLLDHPFKEQRDFPLEWINRYNNEAKRAAARPVVEFWGQARLPEGWGLGLAAKGNVKSNVWTEDRQGRKTLIPVIDDINQAGNLNPKILPKSELDIRGQISYGGFLAGEWGFIPVLVNDEGEISPVFGKGILWRGKSGLNTGEFALSIFRWLAWAVVAGIILFLIWWTVWIVKELIAQGVMDLCLAVIIGLQMAAPFVFQAWNFNRQDSLILGLSLVLFLLLVHTWQRERKGHSWSQRIGLVVLLSVGPAIQLFYFSSWWPEAGQMAFFSVGDDGLTYQDFARKIVLGGDPWQRFTDPVFSRQPLYRWLVAIGHIFFGQSNLSLRLLDVWAVIATACISVSLSWRLGVTPFLGILGSYLYLKLNLDPEFFWLIGSGLQEYSALLFLMLAGWALLKGKDRSLWMIGGAGCLAALGLWLRLDHLGCIVGLGLLMIDFDKGKAPTTWHRWMNRLKRQCVPLTMYWGLLILAFLTVIARNWIFGGKMALQEAGYLEWLSRDFQSNLSGVRILLSAREQGLSQAGWVLWGGTALGITAIFLRRGPCRYYPISLALTLAAIIAPYFLVLVNAYTPRFSVHLLPLTIISLCVFCQHLCVCLRRTVMSRLRLQTDMMEIS